MWDFWYRGPERVQSETHGMQCEDLVLDIIKILGTHFCYNEKSKEEKKFCLVIANIQCVLRLWKLWNLTQAFVTPIPIYVVTELEKVQKKKKSFLWENSIWKIKHVTLCNDYKHGALKNLDIWKKL